MRRTTISARIPPLPWFARLAAAALVLLGILVLLGWAIDAPALKSVRPGLATMKANTALAFLLCGLSLWFISGSANGATLWLGRSAASLVALLAFLSLAEDLLGRDLGVDQLLFRDPGTAPHTPVPGRMSPITALSFLFLGVALSTVDLRLRRAWWPAQWLALAAAFIAFVSLVGYAYSIESLYGVAGYTSIALHTSLGLIVLSAGILCARPDRGPIAAARGDSPGAQVIRRLLPASVFVMLGFGMLRQWGANAGLFPDRFGVVVMTVGAAATLAALVWRTAVRLNRVDARRRQAEEELRANLTQTWRALEKAEALFDGAPDPVIIVDRNGQIVQVNARADAVFGYARGELSGQLLQALVPERFHSVHGRHLEDYFRDPQPRSMGRGVGLLARRKDGSEFPADISLCPLRERDGVVAIATVRDVSERVRAEGDLRRHAAQLRELSRRVVDAEESERRRLARELHDRIGQNLSTLNLELNLLRGELPAANAERVKGRLADCETLLDQTGQMVRNIMNDLRPAGLEDLGLFAALQEHVRLLARRSGLAVAVRGAEVRPRLAHVAETVLFRIAQEALINVVKHAQASAAEVMLEAGQDWVVLTVADNGHGFDAAGTVPLGHLGIVGMRERAETIGARLRIESAPGAGTRVIVDAPRGTPAARR